MATVPCAPVQMVAEMGEEGDARDWAASWRGLALIWGLPAAIMIAAGSLAPGARGVVWTLMLLFMGCSCLVNARRCGRTHCRYTGPFLVLMAGLVALYGTGLLPLGDKAWGLFATVAFGGSAILCGVSESMWGRYRR